MQKLASGLNIELPQLFTKPKVQQTTGRRDITLRDTGKAHVTSTYKHELLATQFSNKKMMRIKAVFTQDVLTISESGCDTKVKSSCWCWKGKLNSSANLMKR